MLLEVQNLTVLYDKAMVLNNVNLHVNEGELVSLVGPNGAGKTTLLRSISGLVRWEKEIMKGTVGGKITHKGTIKFSGQEIHHLPAPKIVERGLVLTPERGRPFREMTVKKNLMIGAYLCKDKKRINENLDKVYQLFPILKERQNQISGTISGGERTMLALGRALMSEARLLMVDEPSVGLAPKIKEDMFDRIRDVHNLGITVLLTEQDIGFAFDLSKRNYVMSQGQITAEGNPEDLLNNEIVRKSYLGL